MSPSSESDFRQLFQQLSTSDENHQLVSIIKTLVNLTQLETGATDWQVVSTVLEDLERGVRGFMGHNSVRKVGIFGSARVTSESREYRLASDFARQVKEAGFMVLTGGGGGIMEAGNQGAGREESFGLNIELPLEQGANPYIAGDEKLIHFQYFFTRKLFFFRESQAIAVFPGGFGTQDETFECLTLCQTGKQSPIPIVFIDQPGGTYWQVWHNYVKSELAKSALIDPDDLQLYTITDDITHACEIIRKFYRIYHSSFVFGDHLVMRLQRELSSAQVEQLNEEFADILVGGKIEKYSQTKTDFPDPEASLPGISFRFHQNKWSRLYQMINTINRM